MAKTQKQPSFEQQLEQLEGIINSLEQGDMPLDKSMEAYKQGVELSRSLKAQLDGAAQELKVLDGADASQTGGTAEE